MNKNWIAIDWGTSNLRLWLLDEQNHILDEISSAEGMTSLAPDEFEPCLMKHITPWLTGKTLVLACGMVGAKQGWYEAEYIATPCAILPQLVNVPTKNPLLDIRIAAGLKQMEPADVMRGEETQIAGFLGSQPDFEGVIALPGTHAKWVKVKKAKITQFQTIMTGESFAFYAQQSVLRFSMDLWDEDVFVKAALESFYHPENTAAKLFNIRARDLLWGEKTGEARLSGLLMGLEIAATKTLWQGQKIAIIGSKKLIKNYEQILQKLREDICIFEGETMVLEGLKNIKRTIS